MKKLRIIAVIVIAAILVGLLFFLVAPSKTAEKDFQIKVVYKEDSDFNNYILSSDKTVVAENEYVRQQCAAFGRAYQKLFAAVGAGYPRDAAKLWWSHSYYLP